MGTIAQRQCTLGLHVRASLAYIGPMSALSVRLGQRLEQARLERALTLCEVVHLLEAEAGLMTTRQALRRWEQGQMDIRVDQAAAWSSVLGLSLGPLIEELRGG